MAATSADQAEDAQEAGKADLLAGLCGRLQLWETVQRSRRAAAAALPGGRLGHGPHQHCCRAALQPPQGEECPMRGPGGFPFGYVCKQRPLTWKCGGIKPALIEI